MTLLSLHFIILAKNPTLHSSVLTILGHYLEKPRGTVVNGVPRVLAAGLPRRTPFTTLHQRLFHIMSFCGHPGQVKRDLNAQNLILNFFATA